jgi:uncharacterized glyoxalase superfamily protein PhnB
MRHNRSMPRSLVIPVLGYPDLNAAIDWLSAAFGFRLRLRIADHRAQLLLPESEDAIVITSQAAGAPDGTERDSVMVRVTDIDRHYERSKAAGAAVSGPPVDYPYGERQYSARDLGGHVWTFSQSIADVDPASWGGTLIES